MFERPRGGLFDHRNDIGTEPVIRSWLGALANTRMHRRFVLDGINPEDAIVDMMREKHHLLIGEPRAQAAYEQLADVDPQHPVPYKIKGRNMDTGLPAAVEISSTEVQAADNSKAVQKYVNWMPDGEDGLSIGDILFMIAAHQEHWLYGSILRQSPPAEIEALFETRPEAISAFIAGQTVAQHWKRLDAIYYAINEAYAAMTLEDFQRTQRGKDWFYSAEWVIHELCQFEAVAQFELTKTLAAARAALDGEKKVD